MKKWIQKKMNKEREKPVMVFGILGGAFAMAAIIMLVIYLKPMVSGVSYLDSAEKIQRFSEGNFNSARLAYNTAEKTPYSFTITRNSKQVAQLVIQGLYVEVPYQNTTDITDYNVWILSGDGYRVLYCNDSSFIGKEDTLAVNSRYSQYNQEIIDDIMPGTANVFVLYNNRYPNLLLIIIIVLGVAGIILLSLIRPSFLLRRTRLGRRIASFGDYKAMISELNRQHETALLDNSSVTLLQDWALFHGCTDGGPNSSSYSMLFPIEELESITISPDEDDDTSSKCVFAIANRPLRFTYYLDNDQVTTLRTYKSELIVSEG